MHEYNPLDHLLEATRALAGLADGADFVVKSQLVPTFGAICGMANDKQTFADNSWNAVQALIQDLKPDCQRDLFQNPRDDIDDALVGYEDNKDTCLSGKGVQDKNSNSRDRNLLACRKFPAIDINHNAELRLHRRDSEAILVRRGGQYRPFLIAE
uniref:Uncharacterized protein B15I20.170 n=1 Tax=Neurospora crassa TaxID=5141 RepID=Q9P3J4_NEUCS|nr:hypothetical protein [Neurospora crassa]